MKTDKTDLKSKKKWFQPEDPQSRFFLGYLMLAIILLMFWQSMFSQLAVKTIRYSTFKQALTQGEVTWCDVADEEIVGNIRRKGETTPSGTNGPEPTYKTNRAKTTSSPSLFSPPKKEGEEEDLPSEFRFRTVRLDDPKLVEDLQKAGVKFKGVRPSFLAQFLWNWLLPLGVMLLVWMYIARKMGGAGQSVLSFGKSKAKLVADKTTGVAFNDVAGCEEAKYELQEVVDFLKNPNRYKALGAKIPKGVLLVGPPGTGKTLLARAVAGEAKVPFFSLSGSDFVEMFVGVGAARVRDLFEQAKIQAPCIVFIDELDAIGRQRGVHIGAVNDEREQTLNQLLVEMDGFEANNGVIILSATNRPDVLDRALLRPGRFDRQVVVDAPDLEGRLAVLKVHCRQKPLAREVDLRRIAQSTPGFSGADLANATNEAALLAARRGGKEIAQIDLENAIEKVVAGPERKSRRLNDEERKRVAYHETGHALVAAYSKIADPVHKISIVPRGRAALGYTMQLPIDDQFLSTRSALIDRLQGLLGGRAAEETVYHEVSTGAQNDLERATTLARQMVCLYGMSDIVGLAQCGQPQNAMYQMPSDGYFQRDCSEQTAREVDEEVKRLLDEAYTNSKNILGSHADKLEQVATELMKTETIDGHTFYQMLGLPMPKGSVGESVPPPVLGV